MLKVLELPVEKIKAGEHAQRLEGEDEELAELTASISRVGILVPLVVSGGPDSFVVVAGHRRLAAAQRAGLQSVPCIVRKGDNAEQVEVSFAENLFRKDLSPLELACAVGDCLKNNIMTVMALAEALHRSVHWVKCQVALLSWPGDVLEAIHEGWLSVSAAANLALIEDETYRVFLLKNAREGGVTARVTAAWLQAWRAMAPAEEAITMEPVSKGTHQTPMVPQAPCIVCTNVFRTDELSHVPVCCGCIRIIREISTQQH